MKLYDSNLSGSLRVSGAADNESYFLGHNVGVGTNNPRYKFHVVGDSFIDGQLTIRSGVIDSGSVLYTSGSNKFGDDMADEHAFTGSFFATASKYNLMGGKVGIGIRSPAGILDLKGAGDSGEELLRLTLDGDRNWTFAQEGSGAGTGLRLRSLAGKDFHLDATAHIFRDQNGSNEVIRFTPSSDSINVSGHVTASGDISGSATSTGSFGSVLIKNQSNLQFGSVNTRIRGDNSNNVMIFFTDNSERVRINDNGMGIGGDPVSGTQLTVYGSVSGSSTSTGSFGHGYIADNLYVGAQAKVYTDGTTVRFLNRAAGDTLLTTFDSNEKIHLDSDGYMKFETAGSERMRIDSSGDVGIGTDNPDGQLHVMGDSGAGSVTAHGDADDLVVEAQNAGISILSLDSGDSSIIWGSPSDNIGAQAKWNHDSNALRFRTSKSGAKMILGGGDSVSLLEITDKEVSGSSTSTGSFARMIVGTQSPITVTEFNAALHLHHNTVPFKISSDSGLSAFYEISSANSSFYIYHIGGSPRISLHSHQASVFEKGITSGGNISGSSTSTGSFGRLAIPSTASFADSSINFRRNTIDTINKGHLYLYSDSVLAQTIYDSGGDGNTVFNGSLYVPNAKVISLNTPTDNTNLGTESGTTTIQFTSAGTKILQLTSTKISGSSTSTGSFGVLKLNKYNQGIGGQYNVILGAYGTGNPGTLTADENVLVGSMTGKALVGGGNNTMIGQQVGGLDTGVDKTVQIGFAAGNGGNKTSDADGTILIGYAAGYSLTSGGSNTIVGYEALHFSTTGASNVYMGYQAGRGTSGYSNSSNVGIGYRALYLNRTGTENVSIGKDSMRDATTSDGTVAVGVESLYNLTSGNNNVGLGKQALYYVTTGAGNVAVGLKALKDNTANNNVAVGTSALENNTTGAGNIAMGYEALLTATELDQNTAIGYEALKVMSGSAGDSKNTAVGYQAGLTMTTGIQNTLIGTSAGDAITTGAYNTAVGTSALSSITTGTNNVVIGRAAASALGSSESGNTVIGTSAMQAMDADNETVDNNIAIGLNALYGGDLSGTSNDYEHNVVIGKDAMDGSGTVGGSRNIFIGGNSGGGSWTTAASNYNTAIGYNTMPAAMNGAEGNTAVGYFSMLSLTTGDSNTTVGRNSGYTLSTGERNTFIGNSAGYATVDVDRAVCIGYNAGGNGNMTSDADATIAIGYNALLNLTTGRYNTAIGYEALTTMTELDQNTAIGYEALKAMSGSSADPLTGNTAVGYQAGLAVTTGMSNTIVGTNAGDAITTGNSNILMGRNAGGAINVGSNNICFGDSAGDAITDGTYNVAIGGNGAGGAIIGGDGNVAIGGSALEQNQTGDYCIGIGYNAGQINTGAHHNIAIGYAANDNTGPGNIGIGRYALSGASSGEYNVAIGYDAGAASSTGQSNVFIGANAANAATDIDEAVVIGRYALKTAEDNNHDGVIAIGAQALEDLNVGGGNGTTAVGYQAGHALTTAVNNTLLGRQALKTSTTSSGSVMLGKSAGEAITTGNQNIAIGLSAMNASTTGDNNIAIGTNAGDALTSGYDNIFMGRDAGGAHTEGRYNHFIGRDSGKLLTTGERNVAIGAFTLDAANGDEDFNIAIGHNALGTLDGDSADGNIGIGYNALDAATTANYNTAIGYATGDAVTTASGSVFMGRDAGGSVTTGNQNIAIGEDSMNGGATTGDNNIAIGVSAGDALTSGYDNIFMGKDAGGAVTTGFLNTLIGAVAGDAIQNGAGNVALGYEALSTSTSVTYATALGSGALGDGNVTSDANYTTAVGVSALKALTSGVGNVAVGGFALDAITTSAQNTAVGYNALTACGDSYSNTAVGYQAGDSITNSGAFNVCIGTNADVSTGAAENQIVIGRATTGVSNNSVTLGNSSVTDVYMSSDKDAMVHCGNVSGSSTSTGSFGGLYVNKQMRIGKGYDNMVAPMFDHRTPLRVSASYWTTQDSAGNTAEFVNQSAECKVNITGKNDNTNGAYGDGRAGASIALRNLDTTSGSYSTIMWYNGTNFGVGGIDVKNICHGTTGHTESEMRFYTRNKSSNYFNSMTLGKTGNLDVAGALSKGSGTFRIPHPVPEKKDEYYLQHSFVESPTRGDNIYRWQIEVKDNQHIIELPDYYQYLNENDMVWVNPVNHFGRGYGNVNEEQTELTINTDADGLYNVLLIGTRKDETAVDSFEGIEIEIPDEKRENLTTDWENNNK